MEQKGASSGDALTTYQFWQKGFLSLFPVGKRWRGGFSGLKPCGQDGFVRDFAAVNPHQAPLLKGENKLIGGKGDAPLPPGEHPGRAGSKVSKNLGEVLWEARSRDLASSPSLWLILEARQRPREVQAIAYEKGLIPYFPADRQAE